MNNMHHFILALHYAPGIGAKAYARLVRHFGDAESVFKAKSSDWSAAKLSQTTQNYLKKPNWTLVEKEMSWACEKLNSIVSLEDPNYPELLKQTADAPTVLYVKGNADCLGDLQLAIVGSRNPTVSGVQTTFEFAKFLGQAGLSITSGLALGIDSAAHQGALKAKASTIAVMGTGMDQIYPAKNQDLAQQIIESGALVTEFPQGTQALPHNFPRRNRIVSALSLGCLVVEAALRSGSLITAKHANEQGREVFAIPGSIHSPLAKGCHQLIKDGAKLVETARDIIVEISTMAHAMLDLEVSQAPVNDSSKPEQKTNSELDDEYQQLLTAIAYDPVSADTLIQRTGFSPQAVSSMLLMLELKGYISANSSGTYTRSNV